MLSEIQENNFTARAKEEAFKLMKKLNIVEFTDDTVCLLQGELDSLVASLVNAREDCETIDEELLKIYDLLTSIVLDNEEDLDFLNRFFFR